MRTGKSFRIGWESAKANALPMAVLWGLAISLVSAYYLIPSFAELLEPVRLWQIESGWWVPFLNRVFFCGVVPGVFLSLLPRLRPRHVVAVIVAESLWNGCLGVAGDWMFRVLNRIFGSGTDVWTLVGKTLVDQFVWTVLIVAPVNAVFHFWLVRNFSFRRARQECPSPIYRYLVAPNLVSNWCVWIPVQFTVFMFPLDLQIHVNGLVCSFWTLMCLQIGRRTK